MVENTDGAVRSRLGCMEIFVCSGMGTGIEWRRFGQRVELGNTTNRVVTVSCKQLQVILLLGCDLLKRF